MSETYVCPHCGRERRRKELCGPCVATWALRPEPAHLSADEREAEMRQLGGPMSVPFKLIHARVEALVGRPVWTHEMAGEKNWDRLCREARGDARHPTMAEVIELIPAEKRVVVMLDDTEAPQ